MTKRAPRPLTFANIASTIALFAALSTGGAYAAGYIVSSNSQLGPNTVSGHQPPSGDAANVVAGSLRGDDLAAHTVGANQLAPPEAWRTVAANPHSGTDPCATQTAVFCGQANDAVGAMYWENAGGPFTAAGFYRDASGRVYLRGLVSMADTAQTTDDDVFVLPAGYRPAHELVFATLDNDANGSYPARVDVEPNGTVHLVNGGTYSFLSLDSISFRVGE